jgi:DNA-binding transcriptional MocR family regulator
MAQAIALHSRPHYRIDNSIVDEYGEKIGAIGIAIYNVLARHADRATGVSFPSIGTIATKLKLGRTTVKKYLRILLNHGLIAISARLSDEGDPTSNSYRLLDPAPEKVALRRRQLEALLTPQHGTFTLEGGRSPADPPPCPTATDPRSPADPEQEALNKENRTSSARAEEAEKQEARTTAHQQSIIRARQRMCAHPADEIVHLSDGLIICNHCYGLLDELGGDSFPFPASDCAA